MTGSEKPGYSEIGRHLLVVGFAFAALFWVVEAFVDRYLFGEGGTFADLLLPVGDPHELLDRTVVAVGLMVLIGYSQLVINRRRQAEEALEKSEERFRSLVQNSTDITAILDADGTIRYESPSAERILGRTPEDMVGMNALYYVHPEDIEQVKASLSDLLTHPGVRPPVGFRIRHADGSWRYFESICNNLLDDPVMQGLVINSRDITARKEAEDALARALREKSDFIADVSHELRTPLTVLRGNAELGLNTGEECGHKETFAKILNHSKRISRMVEDLLFLARSDAGPPPLNLKLVETAPFFKELATLAEALLHERGASLHTEMSVNGTVKMDPEKVEQAVIILLDNAAKYGPGGGEITLSATTHQGELCVEVADNGPGIPEADLPRVFERFYRGAGRNGHKRSGSGLGLPIAKTIAEAHGGRIEAASHANEGTRMSLHLPITESSNTAGALTGKGASR